MADIFLADFPIPGADKLTQDGIHIVEHLRRVRAVGRGWDPLEKMPEETALELTGYGLELMCAVIETGLNIEPPPGAPPSHPMPEWNPAGLGASFRCDFNAVDGKVQFDHNCSHLMLLVRLAAHAVMKEHGGTIAWFLPVQEDVFSIQVWIGMQSGSVNIWHSCPDAYVYSVILGQALMGVSVRMDEYEKNVQVAVEGRKQQPLIMPDGSSVKKM